MLEKYIHEKGGKVSSKVMIFMIMFSVFIMQVLNSKSNDPLLAQELLIRQYQLESLQKSCIEQGISSQFTDGADAIYYDFLQSKTEGFNETAFKNLDKAFIYYRLAMGLHDLEKSRERHERQVESLRLAREEMEKLLLDLAALKKELQNEE